MQTLARLNITFNGENGDLTDFIHFTASDAEIKHWATEAVLHGNVSGITVTGTQVSVNFENFVVDRFPAHKARPYALVQLRPKTPFG